MRSDSEVRARLELAQKQERESTPFTIPIEEASYWISACRWFLGDDSIKLISEEEVLVLGEKMVEYRIGEEIEVHYWEVTNMVTGAVVPTITPSRTIAEAVAQAKYTMDTQFPQYADEHLVIKIFSRSPDERFGVTYEPEYTESYRREEAPKRVFERFHELESSRLFPQTYGDWVSLGMDIKEKAGIDDYETTAEVNRQLNHIYEEEQDPKIAQEAKRALTELAGKFGIS